MNNKYTLFNIEVITVKYQNFAPYPTKQPNFTLMSTLSQSLKPSPIFADDDFKLIGTQTDSVTKLVSLNDYKKIMKVISYDKPTNLFDTTTINPIIVTSSLDDNNYMYLPDSLPNYLKYLNDLQLLQSFIDVNKINNLVDIAAQFTLYLKGLLVPFTIPTGRYRLLREIVIIYSSDKKFILNIQFNQTITQNNVDTTTSQNINKSYDYLIINSCIDNKTDLFISSLTNTINTFGNNLKIRQLIDDIDINNLISKINTLTEDGILYVNYYFIKASNDIGIQLVKRVNGELITMNYFNIPYTYYKNICANTSDYFYKGRCYSPCPNEYSTVGLSCMLNNSINPDSDFCKQLCISSSANIGNYDSVLQKACWCSSMKCEKCGDFSIPGCNC